MTNLFMIINMRTSGTTGNY